MSNLDNLLSRSLIENGHDYSADIQRQFLHYLNLLQHWNKAINLTAIQKPEELITHHILDSLSILSYLNGNRFIDVGTGAGLPGLILAIVQPHQFFCLLDSNSKKNRFLTQCVLELALKNVEVVHARCEKFFPKQCFDAVITRAFSSLKNMLELTNHLLCPKGEFLAMKGIVPRKEIKEIPEEFKLMGVYPLTIKGLNEQRCLVKILNLDSV